MQNFRIRPQSGNGVRRYSLFIFMLSLATIAGAFWLSNARLDDRSRLIGFAILIAAFLLATVTTLIVRARSRRVSRAADPYDSDHPADNRLSELDEAREFFAGSLKLADAFRLMSNRVKDVVPFRAVVLYVFNESRTRLLPAYADGVNSDDVDDGLACQSHSSGSVEIDSYLELDASQAFESTAAIPLRNGESVFGVLQLYFRGDFSAAGVDKYLFETVGERVAPLILSSLAFEHSQAKALTDITTDLPNERAFYLMLEKQIAQSHNEQSGDPLTVLAIDINDFEEINTRYGHTTGDQVLNFVARLVRDKLRQMDFLARSVNDEFLAILPTASAETSHAIIERIHNAFNEQKFKVSETETITIELNIGWATYANEGSTPAELLSFAELKKEQEKMPPAANVVTFPREMVQ